MGQVIDNGDVADFTSKSRTESGEEVQFIDSAPCQVASATVATATAAVGSSTALAASTTRRFWSFHNTHGTDTAYLNIGSAATSNDIPIRAGEWLHSKSFGVAFTQAINVIRGGSNDITLVVVSG